MLSSTFLPTLVAAFASSAAALSGEATFYGGNTKGGMCSFSSYTIPSGIYGTALSDSNWDDSEACGGCVKVTGPNGNSITAMVSRTILGLVNACSLGIGRRSMSRLR